jgi:hypothetical protein
MGGGWQDRNGRSDGGGRGGTLAVGVLLVLLGVFFLASEQFSVDFGRYGWPVYIIVPGLFLLVVGLAIPHEGGLGAAIPGGIITTVGLVLALQRQTDTYASWAYMWALVAPGSVGVTLALFGVLHRRWDLLGAGLRSAATGLGLFIGFGLFFENVIGIDDVHPNMVFHTALPVMAVGLGIVIVIWNLLPERLRSGRRAAPEPWRPAESPETPPPPAPPAG